MLRRIRCIKILQSKHDNQGVYNYQFYHNKRFKEISVRFFKKINLLVKKYKTLNEISMNKCSKLKSTIIHLRKHKEIQLKMS